MKKLVVISLIVIAALLGFAWYKANQNANLVDCLYIPTTIGYTPLDEQCR